MKKKIKLLLKICILLFCLQVYAESNDALEKKSIEELIDQYFATWSNQNMEGYEACFHPEAIIHFERNGIVKEERLEPFIESQTKAHSYSFDKMKEIPISKKIQFDKTIAQVIVRWKLTAAGREQYGYDYFTVIKYKKKWKIIYLIFNND